MLSYDEFKALLGALEGRSVPRQEALAALVSAGVLVLPPGRPLMPWDLHVPCEILATKEAIMKAAGLPKMPPENAFGLPENRGNGSFQENPIFGHVKGDHDQGSNPHGFLFSSENGQFQEANFPKPTEKRGRGRPKGSGSPTLPPAFEAFWASAPALSRERTESRSKVFDAWRREVASIGPTGAQEIQAGLERWKASESWNQEEGRYIKGLAAWLRGQKYLHHPKPWAGGLTTGAAAPRINATQSAFGQI